MVWTDRLPRVSRDIVGADDGFEPSDGLSPDEVTGVSASEVEPKKVKALKRMSYRQSQAAKELALGIATVKRYWALNLQCKGCVAANSHVIANFHVV